MAKKLNLPKGQIAIVVMDIFNKSIIAVGKSESERIANEVRQTLVDRIRSNAFNFKHPLKKETIARKGHDTPLLGLTEDYVESIEVQPIEGGFRVGVANKKHEIEGDADPKDAMDMAALAYQLEFGNPSINLDARPHWRPVINMVKKRNHITEAEISKKMKKIALQMFREANKERKEED